ncbi:MAG: hypothetical protein JJV98_07990 [Desulfosarcina sp.]|nr:hypothetical protein [Desulfobacterales bacterium]
MVGWAARPEIWAYLAQLEVLSRNAPAARRYASLALKRQPDFGFVIRDVLPQLEAMEKAS